MHVDPRARAASLSCWCGPVEPEPLDGGITNSNFLVEHAGRRHFVRIGVDIPRHGVMRFHERAASRAAHAAGISPEVLHCEDGAMVLQFIEGRTLRPQDVGEPETLERIVALVKRCHTEIPKHLRGPAMVFWVFQVVRDYAHTLREAGSRMVPALPRLLDIAVKLERAVGRVSLVFGHNDLLAANFIDDGDRIWLIDWDYAGFNSPLFDLGGLASNNELDARSEEALLERYFEGTLTDDLRHRYAAMKCASLLREAMWSLVSEHHSSVDFDFVAYTDTNLRRFEATWARFQEQ
ncbi:MAG: phosphotransferase family protein [Deltaproteobacteria bacterium]|nr:phosphotransferase family protein [Deltaproteobacteria bacterium]MBW2416329.1 phosphotransferase family protein [Deltaproteobacteria bacterium]